LKGILVKTLVLKLPNFDKDFEMHSDASNFAIRGILVQDGRDTLSQDLGPLHRLQRCGGVD
jgi:hypothetical protein